MNVQAKLKLLEDSDYRDTYLPMQVRAGIAYQVQALRQRLGLSQTAFARKIGKPQSVVSRLEGTHGQVSVQTLLDVARTLGVALIVRYVDYPEFLTRTEDKSVAALQPETIHESLERYQSAPPEEDAYDRNLLARESAIVRAQEPINAWAPVTSPDFRNRHDKPWAAGMLN